MHEILKEGELVNLLAIFLDSHFVFGEERKRIIDKAISCGGTTIRSYTSSLGVTGTYQDYLMVHKNAGKKCKKCDTIIMKVKVGGRGTYFWHLLQ